jgi:hypothetical protein
MNMSGSKPAASRGKSKTIPLRGWWIDELKREIAGRSGAVIAKALNKVATRDPPYDRGAVNRFLRGTTRTYEMMEDFLKLFPDLISPLYIARSYAEADKLRAQSKKYDDATAPKVKTGATGGSPSRSTDVPELEETDENYDADREIPDDVAEAIQVVKKATARRAAAAAHTASVLRRIK